MITPAQRRAGRINLAMLPIGAALVVAASVGIVAVLGLMLAELIGRDGNWGWYVGWSLFAVAIGVRNLIRSFQTLSALDVGGTLVTIGLSAAIVATYPGWWLA